MKSFLYAWAQQSYVLLLVDKHGLSSCLHKGTSTHCLDCLLPCHFIKTMSILPKLQGKDKVRNVRGLLIKTLNMLLFIEVDVTLNQENQFVASYTIVDWGPMLCEYLTAQMILTTLCVTLLLKQHRRLLTPQWSITMTKDFLGGLTVEWPLLVLEPSLINRLGLNNGTFGTCCKHRRTWDLDWTSHRDLSQSQKLFLSL